MKYKEIFKLIESKFEESEELNAEYKNGRIIVSMKRETNNPPKWAIELINTVKSIDTRLTKLEATVSNDHALLIEHIKADTK